MVFFCWWLSDYLDVFPIAIAFSYGGGEGCIESDFVDEAETCGADAETDPAVLFHIVELTAEEVYIEGALRATLGVGNVVSSHRSLSCDLTDSWHCLDVFWMVWLKLWGAGCAEEWNPLTGNACTLWLRNLGVVGTLSFLWIEETSATGVPYTENGFSRAGLTQSGCKVTSFLKNVKPSPHYFFIFSSSSGCCRVGLIPKGHKATVVRPPKNLFLPMTCEDLGQKRILNRSWHAKKFNPSLMP